MKLLLVEPWFTGSHQQWAEGYRAVSRHDVRLAALPGERWRWRLRAGALEIAPRVLEVVGDGWSPEVVLVSGLIDVAVLKGLLSERLGHPAWVIYQHESQIVYPNPEGTIDVEATMHNANSWMVADLVVFNSVFHRGAVMDALAACPAGLTRPVAEAVAGRLADRSVVAGVGIDLSWTTTKADSRHDEPWILWPHRWDWDKRPDLLLRALRKLRTATAAFGLVLAGEDGNESAVKDAIEAEFAPNIVACGPFDPMTYRRLVLQSDIVVSCADHEFFGVGIVEALAAGCVGVLPNRLSYPGLVGPLNARLLYDGKSFGAALAAAVLAAAAGDHNPTWPAQIAADLRHHFDWAVLGPHYDAFVEAIVRP
ncbi:MAG: DUF3524 domain-containing protein [Acidimicrobiales bacterium]